uniref:Apple domain-containing protein n=1 Tax=Plectus sambesii TaxID=2011161 RepID=A0A914WVI0_9BILA
MGVDPDVHLSSTPQNYKVYPNVSDCAARCAAETNFTCRAFVWMGPNSGCVLHGKLDMPVIMENGSRWFLVDLDCAAKQPCWWSVKATNIDPTSIGASMKAVNVQNHNQCQALCLMGVLQPECRAYALTNDPFYSDGYNCYLFPPLSDAQVTPASSGNNNSNSKSFLNLNENDNNSKTYYNLYNFNANDANKKPDCNNDYYKESYYKLDNFNDTNNDDDKKTYYYNDNSSNHDYYEKSYYYYNNYNGSDVNKKTHYYYSNFVDKNTYYDFDKNTNHNYNKATYHKLDKHTKQYDSKKDNNFNGSSSNYHSHST